MNKKPNISWVGNWTLQWWTFSLNQNYVIQIWFRISNEEKNSQVWIARKKLKPTKSNKRNWDFQLLKYYYEVIEINGFPCWLRQQRICLQCRRHGSDTWVGKSLWRREWLPTPVFLPGESQRQRSLVGWVYGVAQNQTQLKWPSSSSSSRGGLTNRKEKKEKVKEKEKRKYIPFWMQSSKKEQGEIRKTSSVIDAKK